MMDNLPVEVVGIILSRLKAANDVVRASITCRKWRNAFRYFLNSLTFHFNDSPAYYALDSNIGMFVTTTIFQTNGLQELSITLEEGGEEFSAAMATAWLAHTRETLKSLYFRVETSPAINILDIIGRRKLEKLAIFYNTVIDVQLNYHSFPGLIYVSLNYARISALDLNLLLHACPKIETLSLNALEVMLSDTQVALELNSSSLKAIYIEAITLVTFILEAGSLEELHLKFCIIKQFTFIGKGSLKHFEFEGGYVDSIDLGEVVNLEVVDVSDFTFSWLGLYQMISRSSNLRVLRIWAGFMEEIVYLGAIAKSFPYLTSLSFGCDLEEHWLHFVEEGSYQMQHLVVVEVGWEMIHDQFCPFLDTFLEKCPILKKLNVHGKVSATRTRAECQTLANFTSSMIQLMRKYRHVDVCFKFEKNNTSS